MRAPTVPAMKNILASVLLLLSLAAPAQNIAPPAPQTDLPRSTLQLGTGKLSVQIASEDRERAIGLMSRTSLGANEGMLFVFPVAARQCFWMRNTLIPLTAAFVADDGRIVNLADMQPLSDESHCSAQPVRFVLEANLGWFAQHGIQAGSRITGAPFGPHTKTKTPSKSQTHAKQK